MYILVEDNPNCGYEERVLKEMGDPRAITQVLADAPGGAKEWCDITAVDEGGIFRAAQAVRIEDSSDGVAWLVTGGPWGLRLRRAGAGDWSLTSPDQWGLAFLVLDGSGSGLR